MATTDRSKTKGASPSFQPAFCHRGDCKATSEAPYCAGCGADIAAYLSATTVVREPAGSADADTQVIPPAPQTIEGAKQVIAEARTAISAGKQPTEDPNKQGRVFPQPPEVGAPLPAETSLRAALHDRLVIGSFVGAAAVGATISVVVGLV